MSVDSTVRRTTRAQAAFAVALLSVAVLADPETTHVPLCPLHAATGLYCPLCGGLRAIHALSRGALGSALRDNAMVTFALAALPIALWSRSASASASRRSRRYATALVVAATAFAVARNLPWAVSLRPA